MIGQKIMIEKSKSTFQVLIPFLFGEKLDFHKYNKNFKNGA